MAFDVLQETKNMPKYITSYDLIKRKDYPTLWAELERLGGKRVLESVWCLDVTSTSAKILRDHIQSFVDADDRVFVCALGDWASSNALTKMT
jgi:CRISPR/Cas system-associated endoribonuclease Cas2